MIFVNNEQIAGIPVLHIADQKHWEKPLPLVMFIHGFTSAKEHNLHYGYLLAERGYRVVLPDALYHGERENSNSEKLDMAFWDIVLNNIKEIEWIKDELAARGLIDATRIGLAGTSMGGITTFGALTQYPWVKAAVTLMGSAYYEEFARWQIDQYKQAGVKLPITDSDIEATIESIKPYDLDNQLDKVANRPLLIWHGKADVVVPFEHSERIYQQLLPTYQEAGAPIRFIDDQKAGHKVTREAFLETVKWFETYL